MPFSVQTRTKGSAPSWHFPFSARDRMRKFSCPHQGCVPLQYEEGEASEVSRMRPGVILAALNLIMAI